MKFTQKVAIFFLRSSRGQGLVQKVADPIKDLLDGTVYLFALKGLLGLSIPLYLLGVIIIIKKGLEVFLGWIDEKVGFWKAENYYSAYELNLFNQELMRKLDKLLEDK